MTLITLLNDHWNYFSEVFIKNIKYLRITYKIILKCLYIIYTKNLQIQRLSASASFWITLKLIRHYMNVSGLHIVCSVP